MNYIRLGDVIATAKAERCGGNDFPILSITKSDGIVLQSDKFKKRIASIDTTNYKVVHRGQLVQGIHIDEANFGIQEVVDVGIVSPAYKIWDIKTDKIIPRYLEIILRSPKSIAFYASRFNGSIKRRERISDKDFLLMKIPCPPVREQSYAIDLLDKANALIRQRKQQLKILDDLVKARFVEMFESYSSDTVKVGSVFQAIRNGVSPSTRGTCAVKVLTLSAITQGAFDESAWKRGMFDEPPADDKRISKTDLYICRGNGNKELVGTAAYSKHNFPDVVFPDTIIAARVDTSKICLPYLFYAWKHPAVRMQIESGARTTNGTFKINQKTLSEIEIMLPPLDVQIQFAAFVNQVDKSKVAVQKALEEAQLLFDSLMQDYFG